MRAVLRKASLLCLLSIALPASARTLPPGFAVGYNEAWVENDYGDYLASDPFFGLPSQFDSSLVAALFAQMAQGDAKIVRIFLFSAVQGVAIDPSRDPETQGLTGEFLTNLETVFSLAASDGLKVYVTALNANDMYEVADGANPALNAYFQRLVSDAAEQKAYETEVLLPVLNLMSKYKNAVYGFDLIDEIEAAINAGYFADDWVGARAWIKSMATFVHTHAPWLPLTSTAGWGYPVQEVTLGLFSGLGLDFYDVHIYADSGQYPGQTALCDRAKADDRQIVLGEFGQQSAIVDDSLQVTATANFLYDAWSSCFTSALAWKFEATGQPWFSYLYITPGGGLGGVRPAYAVVKAFGQ